MRRNSSSHRQSSSVSPSIFPALGSNQTTQARNFFGSSESSTNVLRSAARLRRSATLPSSDASSVTSKRDVTQWLMSLKWPGKTSDIDVGTCCEVLRSLSWSEVEQLHTQDLWDLGIRCPHVSRFIIQQIGDLRIQDAMCDGSENRAHVIRKYHRVMTSDSETGYKMDGGSTGEQANMDAYLQIPTPVRDSLTSLRVGGTFSDLRGGRERDERTIRRTRSEMSSSLRAWYRSKAAAHVSDPSSINLQGRVVDASTRQRRLGGGSGKAVMPERAAQSSGDSKPTLQRHASVAGVVQSCAQVAQVDSIPSPPARPSTHGTEQQLIESGHGASACEGGGAGEGTRKGLAASHDKGAAERVAATAAARADEGEVKPQRERSAAAPTEDELSSWSTDQSARTTEAILDARGASGEASAATEDDSPPPMMEEAGSADWKEGRAEEEQEGSLQTSCETVDAATERQTAAEQGGGESEVLLQPQSQADVVARHELARLGRHMLRKLDPIAYGLTAFQRPCAPHLRTDAASIPDQEPLWTHIASQCEGGKNGSGNGGRRSTRVVYDFAAITADKGYNSEMRYGSMLSSTYYQPTSADDTTLVFDSRFESGNLSLVHQHGRYTPQFDGNREYDLYLTADTNASGEGHKVWFFFSIKNCRPKCEYKFRISNMTKNNSLFGRGQRPLMYSEQRAAMEGVGWHRVGEGISYAAIPPESLSGNRSLRRNNVASSEELFALCFSLQFPYDDDTCYLAFAYPYPYSRLQHDLADVMEQHENRDIVQRRTLCCSNAGNKLDLLTISAPPTHGAAMDLRKAVVFTARVHPGETNASWIMKGLIDFLVSDHEVAVQLRARFVFKLIPMLNPDGVVNGNCRFGSTGQDLNRQWRRPDSKDHPEIFHTKSMIEETRAEREVVLFCDIHGHSQKFNAFFYGCDASSWSGYPQHSPGPELEERLFPAWLCHHSPLYDFKNCCFRPISKKKEVFPPQRGCCVG